MNAAELIDALQRAGATLVIEDGKARMRGAAVPPELKEAIKGNREEVIAEWKRRQEQARDRYGQVPPADAPLLARDMEVPAPSQEQITAHVLRQQRPVHAWVMARANDYYQRGVKAEDCEWRACVDVIAWQRKSSGQEAAQFVEAGTP